MDTVYSPKGLETQKKILSAASRVVAKKGIENASVTEIAKSARITRSLIQYYLPKKDELMMGLVHFMAKEGYQFFEKHTPEVRCKFAMPEALEKRIRMNFKFFASHPHYFQCFMLFFYRASYDAKCRALNTQIVTTATHAIKESVGSLELAERIYFAMHASIQRCFIIDSARDLEDAVSIFLKEVVLMLKENKTEK